MSKEEKHTLKDLVAMYKKPEDNFVDSFQCRQTQSDTDELNFEAWCNDSGEWPCKQTQRKTMVSK